jgi:hypothetical protein
MRIVIETDSADDGQGTSRAAETAQGSQTLDGGPAPAALLRRFGRIPHAEAHNKDAQTAASGEAGAAAADSEGGQSGLNPLRHGEAIATQRPEADGLRPG